MTPELHQRPRAAAGVPWAGCRSRAGSWLRASGGLAGDAGSGGRTQAEDGRPAGTPARGLGLCSRHLCAPAGSLRRGTASVAAWCRLWGSRSHCPREKLPLVVGGRGCGSGPGGRGAHRARSVPRSGWRTLSGVASPGALSAPPHQFAPSAVGWGRSKAAHVSQRQVGGSGVGPLGGVSGVPSTLCLFALVLCGAQLSLGLCLSRR